MTTTVSESEQTLMGVSETYCSCISLLHFRLFDSEKGKREEGEMSRKKERGCMNLNRAEGAD